MTTISRYCCGLMTLLLLLSGGAAPARAGMMTFNSLPVDPARQISSYTEDGLTLFALDGPPEHFHPVLNATNGTTAARIFGTDGSPQMFTFAGLPFDLVSIDFYVPVIGPAVTFTSSLGATQTVSGPGVITFGPGFQGVTFVRLDISSRSVANIDNVVFNGIPEPSALVLLSLGTVTLGGSAWLRRRFASRSATTQAGPAC